jgi:hypothetical protein
VVNIVAMKDEELNKLKRIEKLTAEQILGGIRVWLGNGKAEPKYTLDKTDSSQKEK